MNFPPPFRSLHSSLFIAFQYLPSPFNAFRRLSLPFIAFITFHRRPISLSAHSLLPRFVLASPRFVLASPRSLAMPLCPRLDPFRPRLAPFCPRLAAFCPRLAPFCPHLAPFCPHLAPFCPHLAQLSRHAPAFPRFTRASLLLHHPLCFTPSPFALLFPIVLRPLFYFLPRCFIYSRCFASFVLLPPPSLYLLTLFCTRFFTPRQPPQTRPRHRKRQRFSHFSKKFCKKPLTKQKKVLY